MRAWLTPENTPTDTVCRRVFIPRDRTWIAAVSGALLPLIYPYNWEKFGAVTPDEAAARAQVMFLDFLRGDCMIGTISAYITSAPPANCLMCDGAMYAREDYPALYDALDSAFIVDADLFAVPDLRGRTVIGAGVGAPTTRSVGTIGGSESVTLEIDTMPEHRHGLFQVGQLTRGTTIDPPAVYVESAFHPPFVNFTEFVGGGEPHDNMPPFVALNYCVVAR